MQNRKLFQVAENRFRSLAWLPLLGLALLAEFPMTAAAQEFDMQKVEAAVLKENWQEVADHLLKDVADDPRKSPNPVLRLIKGHACLALNRNNESVCFFISVVVPEDLEQCREWSDRFLARNANNAIAYYFKGDVLARMKRWSEAIAVYTKALQCHQYPNHPLIVNARGVSYAKSNQFAQARLDFAAATSDKRFQLADAYANIGVLRIQKKDGAQGAMRAFNSALEISPNYALALHGRACIELVLKLIEDAARDFTDAQKNAGCATGLLTENLLAIQTRTINEGKPDLVAAVSGETGDIRGSLQKTFDALQQYAGNPTRKNMDNLASHMTRLGGYDHTLAQGRMNTMFLDNPNLASAALNHSRWGIDHYSTTHPTARGAAWAPNSLSAASFGAGNNWNSHHLQAREEFHGAFNSIADSAMRATMTHVGNGALDNSSVISGCLASFANAICDSGDWPFNANYGLHY